MMDIRLAFAPINCLEASPQSVVVLFLANG